MVVSKQIRDITIRRTNFNTIVITWSSEDFKQYQIRYWSLMDEDQKILQTLLVNNFTLITLSDVYKFQIRAQTKSGWTAYTDERLISLRAISIDESLPGNFLKRNLLMLISPFVILGLIVLLIVFLMMYSRR